MYHRRGFSQRLAKALHSIDSTLEVYGPFTRVRQHYDNHFVFEVKGSLLSEIMGGAKAEPIRLECFERDEHIYSLQRYWFGSELSETSKTLSMVQLQEFAAMSRGKLLSLSSINDSGSLPTHTVTVTEKIPDYDNTSLTLNVQIMAHMALEKSRYHSSK